MNADVAVLEPLLHQAPGVRVFAVPSRPVRTRRATDAVLLAVSSVVLVVSAAAIDQPPRDIESAVAALLSSLPLVLEPVWQMSFDVLQVWALLLVVLAVYRHRWMLARDLVMTVVITAGGALLAGRLVTGAWPDILGGLGRADGPIDYPAFALAASAGVVAVTAPYLAVSLRHLGRALVGCASAGCLALDLMTPAHVVGALALGWGAASLVHLVFGSPAGVPTTRDLDEALFAGGIDARTDTIDMRRGVARATARSVDGGWLDVELRSRDSWDSQFAVRLWRFLWYRADGPSLWMTRGQQLEHQAFVTLLAQQRGAPVAPIVSASTGRRSDALLVVRRLGPCPSTDIGDDVLAACWRSLSELGDAGIRHRSITPRRLQLQGGRVWFSDLDQATVDADIDTRRLDRAQLLVTTAVLTTQDRAVQAALETLGPDELAPVISYIQPAALTGDLLRETDAIGLDIDGFRQRIATALDRDDEELQQLRRFSLSSVLTSAMLIVVGATLVSALADVGIDTIVDAVQTASLPILLLAFVIGQTPRLANALALAVAAPLRIPFGRLGTLQFAITFVNLAMPATAARVAVNIRFFQRNGLDKSSAITIGALDSVAGFVAQISLIVTIVLFGFGSLSFNADAWNVEATGKWLLLLAGILGCSIVAVLIIPRLRNAVLSALRVLWSKIGGLLTPPLRLAKVYAANILVELLFSLCSYVVLTAFDQSVGYADVVLVNVAVALFAGLVPVPGGMGVTEAALTAGYMAIGVDDATAVAAALCYRLITFYTPPIYGARAFHSLQRQHLL